MLEEPLIIFHVFEALDRDSPIIQCGSREGVHVCRNYGYIAQAGFCSCSVDIDPVQKSNSDTDPESTGFPWALDHRHKDHVVDALLCAAVAHQSKAAARVLGCLYFASLCQCRKSWPC